MFCLNALADADFLRGIFWIRVEVCEGMFASLRTQRLPLLQPALNVRFPEPWVSGRLAIRQRVILLPHEVVDTASGSKQAFCYPLFVVDRIVHGGVHTDHFFEFDLNFTIRQSCDSE